MRNETKFSVSNFMLQLFSEVQRLFCQAFVYSNTRLFSAYCFTQKSAIVDYAFWLHLSGNLTTQSRWSAPSKKFVQKNLGIYLDINNIKAGFLKIWPLQLYYSTRQERLTDFKIFIFRQQPRDQKRAVWIKVWNQVSSCSLFLSLIKKRTKKLKSINLIKFLTMLDALEMLFVVKLLRTATDE